MEITMSTESKVREAVENILEEREYEKHYLTSNAEVKKVMVELDDGDFLIIEG
jgi:hypothetical protein